MLHLIGACMRALESAIQRSDTKMKYQGKFHTALLMSPSYTPDRITLIGEIVGLHIQPRVSHYPMGTNVFAAWAVGKHKMTSQRSQSCCLMCKPLLTTSTGSVVTCTLEVRASIQYCTSLLSCPLQVAIFKNCTQEAACFLASINKGTYTCFYGFSSYLLSLYILCTGSLLFRPKCTHLHCCSLVSTCQAEDDNIFTKIPVYGWII